MASRWSPALALEVGIDGITELSDPETHEPLNQVLQVRSKATEAPLRADSGDFFEHFRDERHLTLRMRGNAPLCSGELAAR